MTDHSKPPDYFVRVPEWIVTAGLSPQALAMYVVLLGHVNRKNGKEEAFPGMDVLAELLGFSKRQSLLRYLNELVELGVVEVEARPCKAGRRNHYTVRRDMPAHYSGATSVPEFHKRRRAAKEGLSPTGDHPSSAPGDDRSSPQGDENQTNTTRRSERDELTSSDAASGAPLASSQGDIKIMKPRGFDTWDDGRAWQYLTGAAIRIMRDSGLEPADDAAARIGQALRVTTERGESRERLLELLAGTIRLAGTDHETWGSLARPASRAS